MHVQGVSKLHYVCLCDTIDVTSRFADRGGQVVTDVQQKIDPWHAVCKIPACFKWGTDESLFPSSLCKPGSNMLFITPDTCTSATFTSMVLLIRSSIQV